jgi:peptide/nickel transport system permease protein
MSSTEPINSVVRSNAERKQIQKERLALLRKNKAFVVGTTILFIWIVLAIFGNLIAPYAADEMSFEFTGTAPSSQFWFGTDSLGQDVFSRVLIGARSILVMSFSATILGTMIGSSIGLASGYFKGALDTVIMRLLEAISAIPVLIIALLAIAAVGGRSPVVTVLVIGFVFAPNVARTVRATVLGETELVAAARLRAERTPHILFREVLPNVLPPIIVEFTVRLGYAIFAIATLSFLGAGVETGSPNWGMQISENWSSIFSNTWWPTLFPALAIASLAVCINLISDGLLEVFEI